MFQFSCFQKQKVYPSMYTYNKTASAKSKRLYVTISSSAADLLQNHSLTKLNLLHVQIHFKIFVSFMLVT